MITKTATEEYPIPVSFFETVHDPDFWNICMRAYNSPLLHVGALKTGTLETGQHYLQGRWKGNYWTEKWKPCTRVPKFSEEIRLGMKLSELDRQKRRHAINLEESAVAQERYAALAKDCRKEEEASQRVLFSGGKKKTIAAPQKDMALKFNKFVNNLDKMVSKSLALILHSLKPGQQWQKAEWSTLIASNYQQRGFAVELQTSAVGNIKKELPVKEILQDIEFNRMILVNPNTRWNAREETEWNMIQGMKQAIRENTTGTQDWAIAHCSQLVKMDGSVSLFSHLVAQMVHAYRKTTENLGFGRRLDIIRKAERQFWVLQESMNVEDGEEIWLPKVWDRELRDWIEIGQDFVRRLELDMQRVPLGPISQTRKRSISRITEDDQGEDTDQSPTKVKKIEIEGCFTW